MDEFTIDLPKPLQLVDAIRQTVGNLPNSTLCRRLGRVLNLNAPHPGHDKPLSFADHVRLKRPVSIYSPRGPLSYG